MEFTTTNLLILRSLNSHTHTINHTINSTSGGLPIFSKIFMTCIVLPVFIAFGLFVYGEIIKVRENIKDKKRYGYFDIEPDNTVSLLLGLSFELILIGMLLLIWFVW